MKKLILGVILAAAAAMSNAAVYDTRTTVVGSEVVVEVVNSDTGVVAETKRFQSSVLAANASAAPVVVEEVASLSEDIGSVNNNSSSDVADHQPPSAPSGGGVLPATSDKEVTAYEHIAVAAKTYAAAVYKLFNSTAEVEKLPPAEAYKQDLPEITELLQSSSVVDEISEHEPVGSAVAGPPVKMPAL